MPLDPAHHAKIAAWLSARPLGPCANCHANQWAIGPEVLFLPGIDPRATAKGIGATVVPVSCTHCAAMLFLDGTPMGVSWK